VEEIRSITDRVVGKIKKITGKITRRGGAPGERGEGNRPGRDAAAGENAVGERAAQLAPALRMMLMEDEGSILTFHASSGLSPYIGSRTAFGKVSTSITPDHIVYCNHEPLFVPRRASLDRQYRLLEEGVEQYRLRNGISPVIVCIEKLGVFAWGRSKKDADIALSVFLDAVKIAALSPAFGGLRSLPPDQIAFIRGWEAEKFRKQVGAGNGATQSVVAGKIALVTGAARGFGAGIAGALAARGAHVVIADVREAPAARKAAELRERYGAGRCLAVAADVTREDAVERMFRETALGFGGLDLLVSNAGVLEAGSLEELDPQRFDFVTRVNYRGYYLCCRAASAIMKIQHRYKPGRFMDIVQINSKSGLSGSNRNYAYAGSKFGGIGLTQSFALELVEHNIKVNAVCPGNFFDGPLWSDPKHGLFVQYLEAGKVPGARTVEDVRRFYEEKVPMKRGCRIDDVVRALLYILDQTYETGQAVPVTGGQIMLR
jgi:NAD(P)-dependent dehydrogenase (short-subunit alcohol dehydrogenase family)